MVDPSFLFRPGRFDAWSVLIIYYVRKAFVPMLWIGLTIAIVADPGHVADLSLETPDDTWRALLSPFAGVVIAIALRVGATIAGLLFAIPAAAAYSDRLAPQATFARRIGAIGDRWNVASAFRSLRWTLPARRHAIDLLGSDGGAFALVDRVFLVANIALPIATIIVSVVISG